MGEGPHGISLDLSPSFFCTITGFLCCGFGAKNRQFTNFGMNLVNWGKTDTFAEKYSTMINRIITSSILADFRRKKVIVLLGARQVGKTTLLSNLREDKSKVLMLDCDDMDDAMLLESPSSTALRHLLEPYELVFIDEAQRGTPYEVITPDNYWEFLKV